MRVDSGFYNTKVVQACRKAAVKYSITVKMSKGLRKVIEAIPEENWTPIPYFLEDGADVAETGYRAFGKKDGVTARLIVRRVRPTPGSQLALFVTWSYHAFITNRDGQTVYLEADHRRHAVVESAIRELKYGVGLNHLPSGRFGANAAWLGLNVIAHNMARWTTRIGRLDTIEPEATAPSSDTDVTAAPAQTPAPAQTSRATHKSFVATDTLRRRHLSMPGRLSTSARKLTVHLPLNWPWAESFEAMLDNLRSVILVT